MNSKIENAILRLNRNIERHNKQKIIQFENDIIKINNHNPELWGTLFYIIFIILAPIGFLIYEIFYNFNYLTISTLLLSISVFIYLLIKVVIGGKILEINLKEKNIVAKNNHILFRKIFRTEKIDFNEIIKSELVEKSIKHKHSSSKWLRLSVYDKNGKKYVLTDFQKEYPESSIASDVKNVIDATIIKEII